MTAPPARSLWRHALALAIPTLLLAALAGGALAIERDAMIFIAQGRMPRAWCEFCLNVDSYGHLTGVTIVALAIWMLLPNGKRIAGMVFAAAVAGGSLANLVKLSVDRCRPRDLQAWGSIWDSFGPVADPAIKLHSFPSSHTAVAFAVSAVLAMALPRARWLFWVLAFGVAAGRVQRMAHFPSDVFAGAALGYIVGYILAHAGARHLRQAPDHPANQGDEAPAASAGTSCATLPMRRVG